MNIICVICSDRLTPSDDVFYTPCGHTFHFACLTQWLERSRTCPQCREKVTQNKIHRLYFNFCNNDTIVEDATTLQATVDSLKFQILIKERESKQTLEKCNKFKNEATGLRAEVRKLENEMSHKDTAILALKEQTKFFKNLASQCEDAKKEVARLQRKVDEYKSIQILINAPSEDVDEMISNTRDPAKLLTYITVMKRELTTSVARRKELRSSLRQVQQDLTKVSMERNFLLGEREKRKELEDALTVSEREKRSLEDRLSALANKMSNEMANTGRTHQSTDIGSEHDKRSDAHEPGRPIKKKSNFLAEVETRGTNPAQLPQRKNELLRGVDCVEITSSPESVSGNEENSLRYSFKSYAGGAVLKRRPQGLTGSSKYSLLAKKPRLVQTAGPERPKSEMCFDGFGGHSRNEKFPSPKQHGTELRKPNRAAATKKTTLDDGYKWNIGDYLISDQPT